jgi:spore germination protein KC
MMLLLAVLISGCSDSVDINDKLIVTTIACDKKAGEIWLYIEIANIQVSQGGEAGGGSTGDKYILIKGHGKTLTEARINLERQSDQPLYLSGARTLLITENFAKEDLVEYLYRLRADETYRKKVITIITREDPEKLFNALRERNDSVGYSIEHTIKTLDESGESFSRSTARLLENLSSTYTGILIPCIGLQDKEISLVGYSVVNGNKVTDFISIDASKGLVMLKAEKAKSHFVVPYKKFLFTVETTLTKRKVRAFYVDGKINFAAILAFKAKVMYGDKKTPYNLDDNATQEMTTTLKEMIEKELLAAVEQAQKKYKTDYLQLDDTFRIKYPIAFEKMDWQNEFLKANITIDTKVVLSTTYMMDYGSNKTR